MGWVEKVGLAGGHLGEVIALCLLPKLKTFHNGERLVTQTSPHSLC